MMNRQKVAQECVTIERCRGSVLDYLRGIGCVSPWGTWHRLQKEELNRQDWQITDGKGDATNKMTKEQKARTVEIALDGGNPLVYLREMGAKNPSAMWYSIKQAVKKEDPETFAKLSPRASPVTTCCAPARPSGVEVPDELPEEKPEKPEVVLTIKSEDLTRALDETPHVSSITKPVNYDGFEVTGLKTEYGRFQLSNNGYLFFGANSDDELEMPVELWRRFAEDLPKIMQILGIE